MLNKRAPRPCRSQVGHTISRRYAAVVRAMRARTGSATGSQGGASEARGAGWRGDMSSPSGGGAQALQLHFSPCVIKVLHLFGATLDACWAGEREARHGGGAGCEGSRSARSPWLRREEQAFARGSSAMLRKHWCSSGRLRWCDPSSRSASAASLRRFLCPYRASVLMPT